MTTADWLTAIISLLKQNLYKGTQGDKIIHLHDLHAIPKGTNVLQLDNKNNKFTRVPRWTCKIA